MYLVLGLVILAFAVWFFVFRNKKDVEEAMRDDDDDDNYPL